MEQATTGKPPPPIAINSGGIQILNMNAVRGGPAGIGATVVPSPGSAQTATVVGSPGPPGKNVGPRMISISPQMLANATRPGQPVGESDSESVNQCADDNHELLKTTNAEPEGSPSPASITGVSSSDLQPHACDVNVSVVDDKRKENDPQKDNDSLDDRNIVKSSDNLAEGSNRNTDDVNDLNQSNPAVDKSNTESGPSNRIVISERSVSRTPSPKNSQYSSSSPSSQLPPPKSPFSENGDDASCPPIHSPQLGNESNTCDSKNDQDNINLGNTENVSCLTPKNNVDNLDIEKQIVDRNCSGNESNSRVIIVSNGSKEIVNDGAQSQEELEDTNKIESEYSNDKCIYDARKNDVPVPRDTEYTTLPETESPTSNFGALQSSSDNNNSVDSSVSQLCVQTNLEKTSESVDINTSCDNSDDHQQEFVTAPGASDDPTKCLTTTDSSEPPPLVYEADANTEDMCSDLNKDAKSSNGMEENLVGKPTVDDVDLDMFSSSSGVADSNDSTKPLNHSHGNGATVIQHAETSGFPENSPLLSVMSRENKTTSTTGSIHVNSVRDQESEKESRPKLMGMNLVDFMYMDCEDEIEALEGAHLSSQASTVTTTSNSVENTQAWNTTTVSASTDSVQSKEYPYSPPKIFNEIFSSPSSQSNRIIGGTTANAYGQASNSSSLFWNKNKITNLETQQQQQQQNSPPSCAFQMYGHQEPSQQHQQNLQVAARIPMRNDLHQTQQHGYSAPSATRQSQGQGFVNFSNSNTRDGITNLPAQPRQDNNPISYLPSRANVSSTNVSSEYKINHSHSSSQYQDQQQRCFTNDPQLYSQFLQYQKNYPLGQQENKKEPAKISSSLPPTAGTRGHVPTHHPQQQDLVQPNKVQPVRPVTFTLQQTQYHQHHVNSIRQPTGIAAVQQSHLQQRHYSPNLSQSHYQSQQNPQNSPHQSQCRSNLVNVNGCDNSTKPSYQMQQVNTTSNFSDHSSYNIAHGQHVVPPTGTVFAASSRQALNPGGLNGPFSTHPSHHQNTSSTTSQSQIQTRHLQQQQQHPNVHAMQKEPLPACTYTNLQTSAGTRLSNNQPVTGGYTPSHANFPGLSQTVATTVGSQHNTYPQNNLSGYNHTSLSSSNIRMPYSQQTQQPFSAPTRPTSNIPSSSQMQVSRNKLVGPSSSQASAAKVNSAAPSGWNPPLLQGARAQLLQVLRPNAFSSQNLAGRGDMGHRTMGHQTTHQAPNRMPFPVGQLPQPHSQQQSYYRAQQQPTQVPVSLHQTQQRSTSVIAPIYPVAEANSHRGIPGGSSDNSLPKQSSSTLPSPQMLRNSQQLAHTFRPPSASTNHGPTAQPGAYNQSSVIRPNMYNSSGGNNSSASSSNNARSFYSNTGANNTYYNNQASVIRAPQQSSGSNISSGSNMSACTINRNSSNSSITIERGSTHSSIGHRNHSAPSSAGGYNTGEMTLQSFLSNPSAPFMCPSTSPPSLSPSASSISPLASERSTSGVSGYHYSNNSENWGGASYHARGDNQDEAYPSLSSCQYSDGAMRRYNAPLTLQSLQALSGLPPGANHLLVKTENGQFQLVSVRMQSPTAAGAAPGTPVPSTVAAPPTSMSIAQQLPSNSPLVAPPLPPPHSAPLVGVPPSSLAPPLPPPISSSMITTTTIPPHQSAQQGRIITSSSSNHIVTSWSSSNNNSLVNNNSTTSSPLPVISSTAAHPPLPHPPHIAPPPPTAAPPHHATSLPVPPPSVPSSVIMPPSHSSASNSQLSISTANNNTSSSSASSSTYSTAAQAAISAALENYHQQRAASTAQQQQHGSVMGPPGGSRQQPLPPSNSVPTVVAPAAGPMSNSLPPGASVIRSGGVIGTSSLPPPPPVVVSTSSSAAVAAVANSVISSSTNPSNSNLPSAAAPTSPATFRPQQQSSTASPVPNNNATNNAQSGSMGMGMMTASSNSNMSVQHPNHHHHHYQTPPPYNSQVHPHPQPPQQAPPSAYPTSSYTSNSIASSTNTTANTVSQMSNETAKTKCKNFLSFLLELSAKQNQTVARNVKNLIQGLIDGKVNEENFADRLQKEVNSQPQPCLVGFLKKSLPHLRHSLAVNELKIEGIKPPNLAALVPPAPPVSALVPQTPPTTPEPTRKKPSKQTPTVRPTTPTVPASPVRIITPPVNSASPSSTPPTPTMSASSSGTPAPPTTSPSPSSTKSSKPSKGSSSKSKSNSSSNSSLAGGASASSGPGGTSSKSSIPSTSKSSKEKEKKDKTFSSSGYSGDDDINDVAAMGGVNLAEESQRILGSTEYVGTQIRSCRDETLIQASPISAKFKFIAAKYGLEESASSEVSALLSHAVEERLKTMVEKLSVIAEHRMDVIKLDDRYEITQDVKGQLRFLEELDKLEKKRHDEQEREMLIRAAKSRSKSEDPEQAKLKAKAKEMQRVALEEMRQRDANLTALQAIGPRKKPKLDIGGGSHGSTVPSPMGTSGASSSLGRPQMPLRPRLKRVNLRDLLFLLEHDKETMRSPFLYKNLLLK